MITDVVEISEVKRSDKNTALAFLAQPFLVMKKGGKSKTAVPLYVQLVLYKIGDLASFYKR